MIKILRGCFPVLPKDRKFEPLANQLITNIFIKDEFYIEFKRARLIYSLAPDKRIGHSLLLKAVEDMIYKDFERIFIKGVPVAERSKLLLDRFRDSACLYTNDFSSYEASLNAYMRALEEEMKHWLLGDLAYRLMMDTNRGTYIRGKWFKASSFWSFRASGERETALMNALINALVESFARWEAGLPWRLCEAPFNVEGDDLVTDYLREEYAKIVETVKNELGFVQKAVRVKDNDIGQAFFCSNGFDQATLCPVRDPKKLLRMGVIDKKYLMANPRTKRELLVAQALSMGCDVIHGDYGAPVLAHLVRNVITNNDGVNTRVRRKLTTRWDGIQARIDPRRALEPFIVTDAARGICEEHFNFPVWAQIEVELALDRNDWGVVNAILGSLWPEHARLHLDSSIHTFGWDRSSLNIRQVCDKVNHNIRRGHHYLSGVVNCVVPPAEHSGEQDNWVYGASAQAML